MNVGASETLHSLLQRSLPENNECLDQGIIDVSSKLTIVELNDSDEDAVYHYISHLIRKIIGASNFFVTQEVLNSEPNKRQGIKQGKKCIQTQESSNDPSQSAALVYLDDEEFGSGQVFILDQLLCFDVRHFMHSLPSEETLKDVRILRETDPLSCLGE